MAAFLNRLGDVVLPPNVIWVAPVGGMFHSIQAAIDHAAILSPPGPRLVRVAPGTYDEAIQMAPLVDVEGSGEGLTEITSAFCTAGPPQAGTVNGATLAQLRHVTVRNRGSATGSNQCAAIYLGSAYGTPLRHVRVVSDFSQGAVFGIRMTVTPSLLGTVVLENVVMETAQAFTSAIGISATGGMNGTYVMRNVQVSASSDMGTAFAIQLINANASLEGVVAAAYGIGPSAVRSALQVEGAASTVLVQHSTLRAPQALYATSTSMSATLRIASSLLEGTSSGVVTCFQTYDPTLAPVAC